MIATPVSKVPIAFIYPTGRGIFASDKIISSGDRGPAMVSNPILRTVTQGVLAHLRRHRRNPSEWKMERVAEIAKDLGSPLGVRVVYLPSQIKPDMTARVMLRLTGEKG